MNKEIVIAISLALLLASLATYAFILPPVVAGGTVYIRADGTVDGTNSITSSDNVTYMFTANVNDSIAVERNHIVLDGGGYTVHGADIGWGISLTNRVNVTIQHVRIENFSHGIHLQSSTQSTISGVTVTATRDCGIYLHGSSTHNNISGNTITANARDGIWLASTCHHNNISGNTITTNAYKGIWLAGGANLTIAGNTIANNGNGMRIDGVSNVTIAGNTITASTENGVSIYGSNNLTIAANTITGNGGEGIHLVLASSNNTLTGNTVANNTGAGIQLYPSCSHNRVIGNTLINNNYGLHLYNASGNAIYHNSFIDNHPQQAYIYPYIPFPSINVWDDGYPSGGNYWSDYTAQYPDAQELNGSGLWDTPYVIDNDNQDHYPIIPERLSLLVLPLFMSLSLLAVGHARKKREPASARIGHRKTVARNRGEGGVTAHAE